ncbi:MAG: bifunctional oligoribonuclease/PAP phosphatase NrnA [Clostridia bacterium]
MKEFEKAYDLILKSNNIYIVGHVNPDGDSLGSCFAMYFALKKINKNVNVVVKNYSKSFEFLPNINECVEYVGDDCDLLITLDCSDIARVDTDKIDNKILMIDHHKKLNSFGDVCIIDENAPATCEIVYKFLEYMNIKIDVTIGTYIYLGLMTDTGNFSYSSTTKFSYIIASNLIDIGVDFSHICRMVNIVSEGKLKLTAYVIDNMEIYDGGKIRYSFVDNKTLKSFNVEDIDAEGMANNLRNVYGTEVAVYVRENEDGSFKFSLRSGSKVDVSIIAHKFNGGGHKRAAGFNLNILDKDKVIVEIRKLL